MTLIYQTEHFIVESHDKPLVTRKDGGHLRIRVKDESITERTKLSPKMAIEFMHLFPHPDLRQGKECETAALPGIGLPAG